MQRVAQTATLADLARWTGGDMRIVSVPTQTEQELDDLFSELRYQYLIIFEPGPRPGWHPLEIRTRKKGPGRSCAERIHHRAGAKRKLSQVWSTEERDIMRKSLFAVSMLALTVAVAPACASKKFVRTEVGGVNPKVDTLSGTVEETQERTRKNEERIGQVDPEGRSGRQVRAGRAGSRRRRARDGRTRWARKPRQPPPRLDNIG